MFFELQNTPDVPISLEDAKAYLRVDTAKDDLVITDMIHAATEWGELYCSRDFSNKEWIGYFDELCVTNTEPAPFVSLNKSPVTSVASVEISSGGTLSATNNFIRKRRSSYDRLLFSDSVAIDDSVAYTIVVNFTSGYTHLPYALRSCLLQHIAFLYENRGDAPSEPTEQIKDMYNEFRHIGGYA